MHLALTHSCTWSLTGPIVLVGHSYGGNVISMAAVGNDQGQGTGVVRGLEPR